MNYKIAKELNAARFPYVDWASKKLERYWTCQHDPDGHVVTSECYKYYTPTLSELIEACGDGFVSINRDERNPWIATNGRGIAGIGSTPEEAVAMLWIKLQKE